MAGTRAIASLVDLFGLPDETAKVLASDAAAAQLLRYPDRVHLRLVAMQPKDSDGRRTIVPPPLARPRSTSSSPRTWSSPATRAR